MSGVAMMLKAMGVDPGDLMQRAELFQSRLDEFVVLARDIAETSRRTEQAVIEMRLQLDGLRHSRGLYNLKLPDDGSLDSYPIGTRVIPELPDGSLDYYPKEVSENG